MFLKSTALNSFFLESVNNDKLLGNASPAKCHMSKSGSFSSDTRDFFDDEIADQPALMFSGPPSESCNGDDIDEMIFRMGGGNHNITTTTTTTTATAGNRSGK